MAKKPTKDISPSKPDYTNQVILLLSLVMALEITGIFLLVLSARNWLPEGRVGGSAVYDNLHSRNALYNQSADQLTIKLADKAEFAGSDTVSAWQSGIVSAAAADKYSSLANYFHAATGTSHPWTKYRFGDTINGLAVNDTAIGTYLKKLAGEYNRSAQDAVLKVEEGKAVEFAPHSDGQKIDLAGARRRVVAAVSSEGRRADMPVYTQKPNVTLPQTNDLGIEKLLVSGVTDFSGSSNSRIHNIEVGAAAYRGLIVRPGEEFSFNENLGPVNAAAGYLPELVIKRGGTVPEFGGGLCQVSTTAFRAAFFAGLPITARRNHSYSVKYYNWISDDVPYTPGLDATIYPGVQDMKFVNDTSGAILIWTRREGNRLYFDFYGKPDGRQVAMEDPYVYDKRASGAVKATVRREVTKNGETREDVFNSNYASPNLYPQNYEYVDQAAEQNTPPGEE